MKPGRYNMGTMIRAGIRNDTMSSARVAPGYGLRLFQHVNYRGRAVTFTSDDPCFVNNRFNDTVSSVEVFKL